jgi:DNA-binding transcriptional MerR regulator
MRNLHPPVSLECNHLPDRLFYKIGEVSRLTGVPAYILRYWESEFDVLAPQKSRSGQRLYRKGDIETVFQIKQLLYREGFTIAGARTKFRTQSGKRESSSKRLDRGQDELINALGIIRQRLQEIACILDDSKKRK